MEEAMQFTQIEYPSEDAWRAEGQRRFGPDVMKWRFICPVCKTIQTPQDYKDTGAKETVVAFSCIGRWNGLTRGCDYAGGGLFRLNPVHVVGHQDNLFDFAPDPAGQTATQVAESEKLPCGCFRSDASLCPHGNLPLA